MDFVRKLGKGEATVEASGEVKGQGTADVKWTDEFVSDKEGEEGEMGYWGRLEKEWQEMAG